MTYEQVWRGGEWRITIECDYCLEPVFSTGPLDRGVQEAALLATVAHGVFAFCSPECRDRFLDVVEVVPRAIADDVGPDLLVTLLPDGTNGVLEWPDA